MTKVKTSRNNIPNFHHVAPSIHVYTPPSFYIPSWVSHKQSQAPSLVLLCTWTGAQNRHIAKYTAHYQSLFPTTRIMVIATTAKDLCFRNSRQKQERLRPAVRRISSLEYLHASGTNAGILLHVFSEGGSNKACELAEAYYNIIGKRLPVAALCLDSTPGHPEYRRLCHALNKSLPPIPGLRHIGLLLMSLVLGVILITYRVIKGWENNVVTRTRRRLLDPKHFDLSAPRCYLYSKGDALIDWQAVYEHVEESLLLGVPVRDVLFEESGHVGHARAQPDRYWGAVMDTWRSATASRGAVEEKQDFAIVVEAMDESTEDYPETSKRWSDADSQRTLLPDPPSPHGTYPEYMQVTFWHEDKWQHGVICC